MMNYIKNISLFVVVSILLMILSNYLQSDYVIRFLEDDLITILITVFAINTATHSLLITDLANLSKSKELKFRNSFNQIKLSIMEQLVLIGLAFVLLMIRASKIELSTELLFALDTLLVTTFIYSIDILRDTAVAVFQLIEFRNKEEASK